MPEQAGAASRLRATASQSRTEPADGGATARAEAARVIVAWTPAARTHALRVDTPRTATATSTTTGPATTRSEAIGSTTTGPATTRAQSTAQKPSRPATTRLRTARPQTGRAVTARGAMLAVLGLFLLCLLMAGWLGLAILPGVGYMAGCAIAPSLVSRRGLLQIVAAPPALFLVAVVVVQILDSQGSSRHGRALSVVEGTVLTLAATAPWLLLGTALGVANALRLGLFERIGELRAELRQERGQRSEPDVVA